jgi:MFS family permease
MLGIISGSTFFIGPIIVGLGYEASKFGMNVLIADRALMGMGVIVSMISIISLVGTISSNPRVLLFSFYSLVILVIFIFVFSTGAWLMLEDIQSYIDRNWEDLRLSVPEYNMVQFKIHAESEVQSLVSFSFTAIFLNILGIGTIWMLITKKIKKTLLPVTTLVLSILGSALIAVSIYSRHHSSYTQLPLWSNYIFTFIGFIVSGLGIFGYYSVIHSRRDRIILYSVVLGMSSVLLLVAGIGYILLAALVSKNIQDTWPQITSNLTKAGYEIEIEDFIEIIKINLKLAGLFGVVNFVFFLLSFVGAVFYINSLKSLEENQSVAVV